WIPQALVATLLAAKRHQRDKGVGRRATYERASVTPVWKILLRPPGAGETLGDAVTLWVFPIVRSPLERITEEHEHDHRNSSRLARRNRRRQPYIGLRCGTVFACR